MLCCTIWCKCLMGENFDESRLHRLKIPYQYVTGFWKTNQNVTLGQLHFFGPANSHTHTLSMHCCNTRLSCLVCFSRVDFADHVKPQLRQWDPWRAMGGMGLIFTPVLVKRLIGPPGLSRPMTSTSWTHSYSKQSNWTVQPAKL